MSLEYLQSLNLDDNQLRAFNFGYVNLNIHDCIVLLKSDSIAFDRDFKHYYTLGQSYSRFEALKRLLNKSFEGSIEDLKEYANYRNAVDKSVTYNQNNEITAINTTELIKKLKEQKEN